MHVFQKLSRYRLVRYYVTVAYLMCLQLKMSVWGGGVLSEIEYRPHPEGLEEGGVEGINGTAEVQ